MKASSLPTKIQLPFGANSNPAYIRPVPVASQQGIVAGAASFNDGFPPVCFQQVGSGGIPPAGPDFQYLFNLVTAWNQWQSAGGTVPFDQAFANAVGGYPYGAIVQSTASGKLWFNTADNNTTNPDGSGAANWVPFGTAAVVAQTSVGRGLRAFSAAGTGTWTVPSIAAGNSFDVYWVYMTCVGAGGGAPGMNTGATLSGGGGGAGGTAAGWVRVTPGQSIPYSVGAGGVGVGYGGIANAGGPSSISSIMSATGGQGGQALSSGSTSCAGGAGGSGTGGQLNLYGGNGGDGNLTSPNNTSGGGGASSLGGGGRAVAGSSSAPLMNGRAPGSGAGAAYYNNATYNGGTGADGYVSFQY